MKMTRNMWERILNAISLGIILLVAGLALRHHFLSKSTPDPYAQMLLPGSYVDLPNVDWSENRTTLIMAMAVGCHWCRESASFYRDLLASNSGLGFHPIAVFPNQTEDAPSYLRSLGVGVKDIRLADFSRLGVPGTPTLIVADDRGRIASKWIGEISPDREFEVFAKLHLTRVDGHVLAPQPRIIRHKGSEKLPLIKATELLKATELVQVLRSDQPVTIVDARPRSEYTSGHISNSINIPNDEIEARAVHEVPRDSLLVAYCHYCPPCELHAASNGVTTYCGVTADLLNRAGFSHVVVLTEDLVHLKSLGVQVIGNTSERTPIIHSN